MDFIFIIGPSAVGKTTLARSLYKHYNGVYLEQNMVPEFCIPSDSNDPGLYEEQLCWDNVLTQLKFFYDNGLRHIVALDFDDIRTKELPKIFRGYKFIILRLFSSNADQIKEQMEHRKNNEGGLYMPNYIERSNSVIMNRRLLPNEIKIDVAGKTPTDVLQTAISVIDNFEVQANYDYDPDREQEYLSWVQSRQLY